MRQTLPQCLKRFARAAAQERIKDITGRVNRLEAQLELLTGVALVKKLKGN